ncbi:MAG: hypothetical protein ABI658_21965 [Acidimicrobiales bacterium]
MTLPNTAVPVVGHASSLSRRTSTVALFVDMRECSGDTWRCCAGHTSMIRLRAIPVSQPANVPRCGSNWLRSLICTRQRVDAALGEGGVEVVCVVSTGAVSPCRIT